MAINKHTGQPYMMTYQQYLKYNRSGIYSISVVKDNYTYLLYVGQSKNMYKRVQQHVREILKDYPPARKYQILHNAKISGYFIQFEVLEYCEPEALDDIEQKWIEFYQPSLNTIGMTDDKTIDERLAADEDLAWLLELDDGWFHWE